MRPRTLERLQYFVGKVCSVVSSSMNRAFDEQIAREHFVVRVHEINDDGIWGSHPYNPDLVSFFSMPSVISIHEEVELDHNNPEHKAMIDDYEKRTGKKLDSDLQGKPKEEPPEPEIQQGGMFVDIQQLENLAEQTKQAFDVRDKLRK